MELIQTTVAGALLALPGFSQATFSKGLPSNKLEIPLAPGLVSEVGEIDRDTDHATVAINESRDIVVTYHAKRNDIVGSGTIQQVEFAYFKWTTGDVWEHVTTEVIGSPFVNPLAVFLPPGSATACVRPDVIAVGDKFFITWTRVYRKELAIDDRELGTIECAWLEKDPISGAINKYTDPTPIAGKGFVLEAHDASPGGTHEFFTRECRGVADAVLLNGNSDPTVGVVYPHQTDFSKTVPGDVTRRFTLRMATCSIDTNNVLSANPVAGPDPVDLVSNLPFDGIENSAGMILPDLAPSPADNAFWLIAEIQNLVTPPGGTPQKDGAIKLGYWRLSGGTWTSVASKTFLTEPGQTPRIRRRPMISSYPVGAVQQGVSLAFNELNQNPSPGDDASARVIYRHWIYDGGSISPPPSLVFFPNDDTIDSGKCIPLRGRDTPVQSALRRCHADESPTIGAPPDRIVGINDLTPNVRAVIDSIPLQGTGSVGRPATAYVLHDPAGPSPTDYAVVTWERRDATGLPLRIWIGVE